MTSLDPDNSAFTESGCGSDTICGFSLSCWPAPNSLSDCICRRNACGDTSDGIEMRSLGVRSASRFTFGLLVSSTIGTVVTPEIAKVCCGVPRAFSQAISRAEIP